jgi:hypothetical protein
VESQQPAAAPVFTRRKPIFPLAQAPAGRIIVGMMMVRLLYVIGGLLFLLSATAHLYARVYLRPRGRSDLDDYYYEFEDQHPAYARYGRWLQVSLGGAACGVLLLFLGMVL